jgi:A/G-specific adenine glycosylase
MVSNDIYYIRRRLLRWYDMNRRDLPWRRTTDPYAVWIAESMLQQTQVKTVLPYYDRFMKTLPSIDALDRARLPKVLTLWSGLGYYRRAENLKRAAREIVRDYRGKIPASYDSLRSLPGIGDYTAGALMSIVFGRPFPAVDGNARRVLQRFSGAKTETEVRALARRIVPRSRPGDFNQALMELGATICVSRIPNCLRCPLAPACASQIITRNPAVLVRSHIAVTRLEHSTRRSPSRCSELESKKPDRLRNVDWPLAMIRGGGKLLLRRRSAHGILAGLWELPGGERAKQESLSAALQRQMRELKGDIKAEGHIAAFHHSITNQRISSSIFLFSVRATLRLPNRQWRWFTPASLDRQPISAMTRKAIKLLQANDQSIL